MNGDDRGDEWLWGWDPTPGIVSVWAEADGRATVWRRVPGTGELVREEARFRPWILLDRLDDLVHLGPRLSPEGSPEAAGALVCHRELEGPGELRYLVRRRRAGAGGGGAAGRVGPAGAARGHLRELGAASVFALPPEEQYHGPPFGIHIQSSKWYN